MPRRAARSAISSTGNGPAWADPSGRGLCGSAMSSIRIVQCAYLVSHQSGFVKLKMRIPQRLGIAEVRFERAERRDQDAGGGFLADAAATPALLEGPFLDRPFPAEHVPQAGAGP